MLQGLATESMSAFAPPVEKAPSNFTSLKGKSFENSSNLPIFEKPTITNQPKFESQSMIEIPNMDDLKALRDHTTPLEGSNPGAEIAQNQFEKIIEAAMKKNQPLELSTANLPKTVEVKAKLPLNISPKSETTQKTWNWTIEDINNFMKNFFEKIRSAIR